MSNLSELRRLLEEAKQPSWTPPGVINLERLMVLANVAPSLIAEIEALEQRIKAVEGERDRLAQGLRESIESEDANRMGRWAAEEMAAAAKKRADDAMALGIRLWWKLGQIQEDF